MALCVPVTRPAAVWVLAGALAVQISLTSASAQAQTPDDRSTPATFEYQGPSRTTYLRAVLELQSFFAMGFLWYLTSARESWDPEYRWDVFKRKLEGGSFGHDDNAFATNFRGHPAGGMGYYLSARGNRLSIAESLGFAFTGSLVWEYFGEVTERVSANDMLVTPIAGMALGEPFTQLAGFFDRGSPTTVNRALGIAFGPITSLNDWLDGVRLSRLSGRRPEREWHDFRFSLGAGAVREGAQGPLAAGTTRPEARIELSERLARLPGYDGPAERQEWFSDANLSGMSLKAAVAEHGLSDFAFETHAVLAGHYARSARGTAQSLHGSGVATGARVGFSYLLHDYNRREPGDLDRAAFIEPLGLFLEYRRAAGPSRFRAKLEAGPAYGGVHAFASDAYRGDLARLPRPLREFAYYFGAGGRVSTGLEMEWQPFTLGATMIGWAFGSVDERVAPPIFDAASTTRLTLGYRGLLLGALELFAERNLRLGQMGSARARATELVLGAATAASF